MDVLAEARSSPRSRIRGSGRSQPSRRARDSLRRLSANAQFVAFVEEGVELPELALEKWLWFLSSHQEHLGVTGAGLEDRARLYRKAAIDAAGGCDAAWVTAHPLGSVPWTGTERDMDRPLHERHAQESWYRPQSWIEEAVPFRNVRPKRKRRMMLISPFMSLGGADRFNIELLRGLSGRGWDLTVATTRAADHALYRTYEEITADLFPAADVAGPFDVPLLLDYLIDSRRPDVVMVSQTELGYRLLPYLRSREFRPAFVDLCHSEDEGWYEGGFPRFSVEYGGLLDGTLVGSNHLRDWMVERGADAGTNRGLPRKCRPRDVRPRSGCPSECAPEAWHLNRSTGRTVDRAHFPREAPGAPASYLRRIDGWWSRPHDCWSSATAQSVGRPRRLPRPNPSRGCCSSAGSTTVHFPGSTPRATSSFSRRGGRASHSRFLRPCRRAYRWSRPRSAVRPNS